MATIIPLSIVHIYGKDVYRVVFARDCIPFPKVHRNWIKGDQLSIDCDVGTPFSPRLTKKMLIFRKKKRPLLKDAPLPLPIGIATFTTTPISFYRTSEKVCLQFSKTPKWVGRMVLEAKIEEKFTDRLSSKTITCTKGLYTVKDSI